MNFSNLKKASDFDVKKWLEEELKLTPYQKDLIYKNELVRFAPFYFYETKQKEKISFLWRLTILLFPIYYLVALIGLPINMIITGKWGYGQDFLEKFHYSWLNKLKL